MPTSMIAGLFEAFTKVAFLVAIPMQVMLWPTVSSVCFACVYGVINIFMYLGLPRGRAWEAVTSSGVFVFRSEKKYANYIFMIVMFCYFAIYFFAFLTHEARILPPTTLWLDPSIAPNYTSGPLPVEVTSQVSKQMRENPYEWGASIQAPAPLVVGTIPGFPSCQGQGFKCYAKALTPEAPSGWSSQPVVVPLSSQFYDVDVAITPGGQCSSLEVYRVVVDAHLNVVHPLDYPASTIPSAAETRMPVYTPPCSLFGNTTMCLQISHTFTHQQYHQELVALCAQYNNQLILRLPQRTPDVDKETGRMLLDVLMVSDSATAVNLHARWIADKPESNWFLFSTFWKQVVETDQVQAWRESTRQADMFFKFVIASLPAIVTWYYLSAEFRDYISKDQVLLLSIFVELPAILLFLSLGAWLPMAGCIVCVLAVNYDGTRMEAYKWLRPALLFIKAACNSVQFAWLLTLVGQAGWNAFYYQLTLQQLYSMSYRFIITDQSSPTWIALMLPIVLQVNFAFLVGTALCVVLESVAARRKG
jgi:hypothetical protein